jgi:hypothetical protein
MRERVRPVIADEAKSQQFLAAKRLALNPDSLILFLDYVTRDFFAALALLARRARGNHGPDKWAEQFPRFEGVPDLSVTPWTLFERWIGKAKPATSTVDRWRAVFLRLQGDFPNTSANGSNMSPFGPRSRPNSGSPSPSLQDTRQLGHLPLPVCRYEADPPLAHVYCRTKSKRAARPFGFSAMRIAKSRRNKPSRRLADSSGK